jgi:hypothetical protein
MVCNIPSSREDNPTIFFFLCRQAAGGGREMHTATVAVCDTGQNTRVFFEILAWSSTPIMTHHDHDRRLGQYSKHWALVLLQVEDHPMSRNIAGREASRRSWDLLLWQCSQMWRQKLKFTDPTWNSWFLKLLDPQYRYPGENKFTTKLHTGLLLLLCASHQRYWSCSRLAARKTALCSSSSLQGLGKAFFSHWIYKNTLVLKSSGFFFFFWEYFQFPEFNQIFKKNRLDTQK